MEILGYVAAVLMGISLGMIGGGGSILTVPILVYLFSINPISATSYSLFIVGVTALVGGIFYYKKNEVDLKTGFIFAVPSFIGVYLVRVFLMPHLPDPVFQFGHLVFSKPLLVMLVFSVMMIGASISMIRTKNSPTEKVKLNLTTRVFLIAIEGFIVGGVTGFVGAGGGFLIIPALVVLIGLPMKIAVGTSLVIIAAKSLIGFVGDLQRIDHSNVNWTLLLVMTGIAISGLFVGTILSQKFSDKKLKIGFGYFVLVIGAFVLFDQLVRL